MALCYRRPLLGGRAVDENWAGWLSLGFLEPNIETGREAHERGAPSECVQYAARCTVHWTCCSAHMKFLKYFSERSIRRSRKEEGFRHRTRVDINCKGRWTFSEAQICANEVNATKKVQEGSVMFPYRFLSAHRWNGVAGQSEQLYIPSDTTCWRSTQV